MHVFDDVSIVEIAIELLEAAMAAERWSGKRRI